MGDIEQFTPVSLIDHSDESIRFEHGDGRDDGLVEWNIVAIALAHLRFDGRVGEVEIAHFLQGSDADAKAFLDAAVPLATGLLSAIG